MRLVDYFAVTPEGIAVGVGLGIIQALGGLELGVPAMPRSIERRRGGMHDSTLQRVAQIISAVA